MSATVAYRCDDCGRTESYLGDREAESNGWGISRDGSFETEDRFACPQCRVEKLRRVVADLEAILARRGIA